MNDVIIARCAPVYRPLACPVRSISRGPVSSISIFFIYVYHNVAILHRTWKNIYKTTVSILFLCHLHQKLLPCLDLKKIALL